MPPSFTKVRVTSAEGAEVYEITSKTTGKALLDEVVSRFGLSEIPLFGLQFIDYKDTLSFIKMDKKVLDHKIKESNPLEISFQAKFFPESATEELAHPVMQRLYWRQIRDGIIRDEIYCPPELCVLFAAYSMQALNGEYSPTSHPRGFINPKSELPQRVLDQHALTSDEWEDAIGKVWDSLHGYSPEAIISLYLTIAQDLEQYGVTYFEVTNKKGTKLWLGIHNLGMDIYESNNKVTPRLGFPWTEIKSIQFNDTKFSIKMVDKTTKTFEFLAPRYKVNKRILALCIGNHELYLARRKAQASGTLHRESVEAVQKRITKIKDQLMTIRKDLERVKDESKLTRADLLHDEHERLGLSKHGFTAEQGDLDRRISEFEALEDSEC